MAIKTTWNLELLYSSPHDPAIERDVKKYEAACLTFAKKYRPKAAKQALFLKTDIALAKAITEYEKVATMVEGSRGVNYFYYRKELNATDSEAEAMLNKLSDRLAKARNELLFFELELGKVPKTVQKKLLKSKVLAEYRYFLERVFVTAAHNLSEPEEKVLNLLGLPSYELWIQGQNKLLSQQTVEYKGQQLPVPAAISLLSTLPTQERRAMQGLINQKLKSISDFAESELNAVLTNKKIRDELRGFKQPYSATILGYHNDEKSIITFVDTVTKNFSISHRFYALKAKLLKLQSLTYADRAAKAGSFNSEFNFEQSVNILHEAFGAVDQNFSDILSEYLAQGQIDAFPKQGKKGGAYCSGTIGLPTYVLLNHANNFDSLKTFAHEMGHAIHTEYSKLQRPLYQEYTISVAEVASTFFENFAFETIFKTLSEKQKIVALHDRLNDLIATIFRQIACFNFELDLHQTLRAKGALAKEEMAELHNKHMKAYLGPLFNFDHDDGYFFVYWSHLRRFFYVYSYAYGALISNVLYRRFKHDPTYIEQIKKFLSAGGSMTPEQIFKSIGIDTSKPAFFEEGLQQLEEDIATLERLLS